jgi:hypothetical protein
LSEVAALSHGLQQYRSWHCTALRSFFQSLVEDCKYVGNGTCSSSKATDCIHMFSHELLSSYTISTVWSVSYVTPTYGQQGGLHPIEHSRTLGGPTCLNLILISYVVHGYCADIIFTFLRLVGTFEQGWPSQSGSIKHPSQVRLSSMCECLSACGPTVFGVWPINRVAGEFPLASLASFCWRGICVNELVIS